MKTRQLIAFSLAVLMFASTCFMQAAIAATETDTKGTAVSTALPSDMSFSSMESLLKTVRDLGKEWFNGQLKEIETTSGQSHEYVQEHGFVRFSASVNVGLGGNTPKPGAGVVGVGAGQASTEAGLSASVNAGVSIAMSYDENGDLKIEISEEASVSGSASAFVVGRELEGGASKTVLEMTFEDNGNVKVGLTPLGGGLGGGVKGGTIAYIGGGGSIDASFGYELEIPPDKLPYYLPVIGLAAGRDLTPLAPAMHAALLGMAYKDEIQAKWSADLSITTEEYVGTGFSIAVQPIEGPEVGGGFSVEKGLRQTYDVADLINGAIEWAAYVTTQAKEKIETFIDNAGNVITDMSDAVSKAIESAADAAHKAIDNAADATRKAIDSATDTANDFIDWLTGTSGNKGKISDDNTPSADSSKYPKCEMPKVIGPVQNPPKFNTDKLDKTKTGSGEKWRLEKFPPDEPNEKK